jgi:phenylalanyl-tRNA synthetase beta chain
VLAGVQGVVDDLIRNLGFDSPTWSKAANPPRWAHPARALDGTLGSSANPSVVVAALAPALKRALGLVGELDCEVAGALIDVDSLLTTEKRASGYAPIPKFPSVKVDVAAAVASKTPSKALVDAIEKSGKGLVQKVELFDLYTGDKIGAGRKSLAYHVHLQSDSKTLSEQEVHKFLERVERELQAIGAELRKL